MTSIVPVFALFFTPILLFGYVKIREARRLTEEAERCALPFGPGAAVAAHGWMGHLDGPQRAYAGQQVKLAVSLYGLLSWTYFFILSLPIFHLGLGRTKWFDGAALTWFMFLSNAGKTVSFLGMMLVFCGFVAVAPLRTEAAGRFYRTRAMSIGFLYWSRMLPMLAALVAAVVTGVALAFVLLLAVRGPVWQHLPATIPRVLGPEDGDVAGMYLRLLSTSAPRVFLSMLTSIVLVFTTFVMLFSLPVGQGSSRGALPGVLAPIFLLGVFAPLIAFSVIDTGGMRWPGDLFFYLNLGPPPPYALALVPVVLSAGLLLLARVFVKHLEV